MPKTTINCRGVDAALSLTQTTLPTIDSIYISQCLGKAANIMKDLSCPGQSFFSLHPSAGRYRSLKVCTTKHRNSFYPSVIRLQNSPIISYGTAPFICSPLCTFDLVVYGTNVGYSYEIYMLRSVCTLLVRLYGTYMKK